MDPIYKNMQSYPYQKDQLHYGPHYHPGSEAVPMPMYMNPVRPPINHQCWPWGSNYGYVPVACHGCCNHTYFPNHYSWGSPYSCVPPVHCPGTYPPFPVQYAPPPSYAMEQPRNNREHGKVNNSESQKDGSHNVQPHDNGKTVEQQPASWNGWYPVDLNNLVSSKPRGDGERNHSQKDNGKGTFPFPLLWIPYKAEQHENEGNKVNGANMRQSLGSQKSSGGEQNSIVSGDKIGGQSSPRAKDIPVREVKQQEDKNIFSNKDRERDAFLKDTSDNGAVKLDNGEKKDPKDGAKRKSTSPPKSPKLPPVCLRVDPLPRRKSANGSSRSPSPPGDKQNPDKPFQKQARPIIHQKVKSRITSIRMSLRKTRSQKAIEVVDAKTSQGINTDTNMETPVVVPPKSAEISINKREEKPEEENVSQRKAETDAAVAKGHTEDAESARGKNEELFRNEEVGANEVKKSSKTKLSEEEAAVIIQSAYRGFDIRRWEPIKKLKQIAKVREQIDEGLHPSIREVRKSVVRELEGDALSKTNKVISSQNADDNPSHLSESQLDRGSNYENLQSFEATPTGEEQSEKEKDAAESGSGLTIEGEDEMSHEVHQNGEEQREKRRKLQSRCQN
ncbi:UNVERIFIED_CONTAM: BAG family molecular chaperone regulator 6 [Sesamum angustifolium]|uniref:BAG family molecular chaperone regulator 6 n=1 Tax=Sesamum angustifolium TaxID=2727405 RepID=A0AAW2N9E4_9LAMI